MGKPKKFMVGRSIRSVIPIGGHNLPGGHWFTAGDVGLPENVLRDKKAYPFLIWEGEKSDSADAKSIEILAGKRKEKTPKEEKKLPKAAKPSIEELDKAISDLSFTDFRKWAKKNYKVTGRSVEGIKKDILEGKQEL